MSYIDVVISNRQTICCFNYEQKQRGMSALATLSRIEEVMRRGLTAGGLSKRALWSSLKAKAWLIHGRYMAKTREMGFLKRFFFRIARKEEAIQALCDRIANLPTPTPLGLPVLEALPTVAFQHFLNFLPIRDIGRLAEASRQCHKNGRKGVIQRAREYGYQERDLEGAKEYLRRTFQAIDILAIFGYIPECCLVRGDAEATLRKIKLFYVNNEELLSDRFSQALVAYATDRPRTSYSKDSFVFKVLLDHGADPNTRNEEHQTALHQLAKNWHDVSESVSILLEYGADPNLTDLYGTTPLLIASRDMYNNQSQVDTLRLLLQRGANPNIPNHYGVTPLFAGVYYNAIYFGGSIYPVVNLFSELGFNLNARIPILGTTLLHWSVEYGHYHLSRYLLRCGADPFVLNAAGQTPFQLLTPVSKIALRMRLLRFPRSDEVIRSMNGLPLQD